MKDLAAEVRRRAAHRCEYCGLPQAAFRRPFHIEHIVAKQHGGRTELDNLALACWHCNLKKGPNVAGVDPATRRIAPLFHPLQDQWSEHFGIAVHPNGRIEIRGLTPSGRATVLVLGINEEMLQMLRHQLSTEGMYPLRHP